MTTPTNEPKEKKFYSVIVPLDIFPNSIFAYGLEDTQTLGVQFFGWSYTEGSAMSGVLNRIGCGFAYPLVESRINRLVQEKRREGQSDELALVDKL